MLEYQSPAEGEGYIQGLGQDPSYLSFGQVVSWKPPVWTGKNFYEDFLILGGNKQIISFFDTQGY